MTAAYFARLARKGLKNAEVVSARTEVEYPGTEHLAKAAYLADWILFIAEQAEALDAAERKQEEERRARSKALDECSAHGCDEKCVECAGRA